MQRARWRHVVIIQQAAACGINGKYYYCFSRRVAISWTCRLVEKWSDRKSKLANKLKSTSKIGKSDTSRLSADNRYQLTTTCRCGIPNSQVRCTREPARLYHSRPMCQTPLEVNARNLILSRSCLSTRCELCPPAKFRNWSTGNFHDQTITIVCFGELRKRWMNVSSVVLLPR